MRDAVLRRVLGTGGGRLKRRTRMARAGAGSIGRASKGSRAMASVCSLESRSKRFHSVPSPSPFSFVSPCLAQF